MDVAEDPTGYLKEDPALYEALMEGYDARNRGGGYDANPYDEERQPKKHRVWLAGVRACRRDEVRHRIRLAVAAGGVYGIEVQAPTRGPVCPFCRRQDETVYPIEEVLETPPIPHEDCESGRCRCSYVHVTDRHHPEL